MPVRPVSPAARPRTRAVVVISVAPPRFAPSATLETQLLFGVSAFGPLLPLNVCFAGVGAGSGRWGMLLRSCPPGPACGQPLLLYFAPQHAPPARSSAPWSPLAVAERRGMPPRESGGQRSEVKEEGRAQPGPG